MNYAASYLQKQENSLQKWTVFQENNLLNGFKPVNFLKKIPTPLEAYPEGQWSDQEQNNYCYLFAQSNCEVIIIFEQCFVYASKCLVKTLNNPLERQAFSHFAIKEFVHIQTRHSLMATYSQRKLFMYRLLSMSLA